MSDPNVTSGLGSLSYGLVGLLVLAFLFWGAKQFFGKVLQELAGRSIDVIRRASANRALAAPALRRYRHAIQRNYAEHRLGFVETELVKIRKIYVPLEYDADGQRADVYERVRNESRVVVLGPPGAGKSLLLKHSMLVWASVGYQRSTYLPVLVELHSCNADTRSLEELIDQAMVHNQVRRGQAFVEHALIEGKLSILFDGLDEVSRDDQDRVVAMLRHFAGAYPDCQIVVTCRNAVYQGQLAPEFRHEVRVADFDDASIRRFLANWPGMQPEDAKALFHQLQDNPQLMRLAANPLLLTMIAYLHLEVFAKSGRSLPTSRPAFYEVAIDHLLRRDHDLGRHRALSRYDGGDKKALLQGTALAMQEAPPDLPDRRSLDRKELIKTIKGLLPDLNIGSDHVTPLIDEIVERSQLLVKLDQRKSRYAFRHLTLQEYLAAVELGDDPGRLLARYFADPAGWRETVKLWCGASSRDCTRVIHDIFEHGGTAGRILALESLAEARRIDDRYAQHVIGWAVGWLGHRGAPEIMTALGAVAADPRPRGRRVFDELAAQATNGRPNAMYALASTRLPAAAKILGPLAERDWYAREALSRMGEQAIPALTELARHGSVEAVDNLAKVDTAAAAEAMAGLLWTEHEAVTVRAAWRLAALVCQPDMEPVLRQTRLAVAEQHASNKLGQWIWSPSRAVPPDSFDAVMERVADLVVGAGANAVPADIAQIDPRLAIPIGLITSAESWKYPGVPGKPPEAVLAHLNGHYNKWSDVEAHLRYADLRAEPCRALCTAILVAHRVPEFQGRVLNLMPERVLTTAIRLAFCRSTPELPSREQWRRVADKVDEPQQLKAFAWVVAGPAAIAMTSIGAARALGTMLGFWPLGPVWLPWLMLLATWGAIALSLLWDREHDRAWAERTRRPNRNVRSQYLIILLFYGGPGVLLLYATATVAEWIGWMWSGALGSAIAVTVGTLLTMISRRTRALNNPLRTIRNVALATSPNGASIIATQLDSHHTYDLWPKQQRASNFR